MSPGPSSLLDSGGRFRRREGDGPVQDVRVLTVFMKGLAVLAAIIFCLGHYSATSQTSRPQGGRGESPQSDANAEAAARAKRVFEQRCAKCHGPDGRGQTALGMKLKAPNFTDSGWQKDISDERMRESITEGSDDMPPFGGKLSKQEIASLVAHIRGFAEAGR